jgi:hypothetical protein
VAADIDLHRGCLIFVVLFNNTILIFSFLDLNRFQAEMESDFMRSRFEKAARFEAAKGSRGAQRAHLGPPWPMVVGPGLEAVVP